MEDDSAAADAAAGGVVEEEATRDDDEAGSSAIAASGYKCKGDRCHCHGVLVILPRSSSRARPCIANICAKALACVWIADDNPKQPDLP